MAFTRTDENDLLIPLHDGIHETPLWSTFVKRLRRRAQADAAVLVVRHAESAPRESLEISAFSPHFQRALLPFDPARLGSLRPGRIYGADDIEGGSALNLRIVRIGEPDSELIAWTMLVRTRDDFGAAAATLLAALMPHLQIALRTLGTFERERERTRAANAVSARLGVGWLAMDAEARVLDADPLADRVLRARLGMARLIGERLYVVAPKARSALARAASDFATRPDEPPRIVPLSVSPEQSLLVMPAGAERFPLVADAAMIGVVRAVPDAAPDRAALIAELFGLPRSEARLAAALADGASIAEAAKTAGITLETARNYSKRVYARTGARGQADLVRLILSSVAALG